MALRLSTPANDTTEQTARRGERLAARAQASLLARDFAGYRALFDETAAIDDVHRRYHARKQLTEQGLAAAGRGGASADVARTYLAVARSAVALLADEPREPYFLNYLGVALYELGSLDAAETLFRAALRLDETVPHVESNLREIARRRKARAAGQVPPAIKPALEPIVARARTAAKKARRVEGQTLSL